MADYPTSVFTFTNRQDNVDEVAAADYNGLAAEIAAVESGLETGLQHDLKPDADATRALGTSALRFVLPTGTAAKPGVAFDGDDDTGLYEDGANGVALATNGTKALGIDSTQFIDSPTQPRCSVNNSAAQSIANSTVVALTADTENFDVGGLHSTSANTSRLTIPTGGDGLYFVTANVTFAASSTGTVRNVLLKKNASTLLMQTNVAGSSAVIILPITALIVLAAADYLEIYVEQDSGGALNVTLADFSIVKLW